MKKFLLPVFVLLSACSTHVNKTAVANAAPDDVVIPGKLFASLFQQRAAEYRALCLQAYNIARFRIDNYTPQSSKPRAVITDLDETALDNSYFEVHQTLQGKDYEPGAWAEWTSKAMADTKDGSVSFFRYAASQGIEVFYVTNRDEKDFEGTLTNLKKYGFPYADPGHLIIRKNVSSKEQRRQAIAETHEIVLLLGDNLADFSALFDKKTETERRQNVDLSASEFGKKFIILPNTVYGDWESSLFQYQRFTAAQKDSVVKASVKGY